jgi:DNA-binding NarL/FixJ family response regulator
VQHVPATVGVPKRKMKITPKQRQVLHYARQGMTNAEIATAMNVKPTTVKTHWDAIYERLGVRRRATALCRCYEMGILQ